MSKNQHLSYFIILLVICAALTLLLDAPERNLMPEAWLFLACLPYTFLRVRRAQELKEILVSDYEEDLKRLGIEYQDLEFKNKLSISDIAKYKTEIDALSPQIKRLYQKHLLFRKLSISSFILGGVLFLLLLL